MERPEQERFLYPGERLDDLQYHGLHLIQSPDLPCFSMDSILLIHFVHAGSRDIALDLCGGTGIIASLVAARTRCRMSYLELQPRLCDMASRSFAINHQDIPVHCLDVKDAPKALGHEAFSCVVCNPPYFSEGAKSQQQERAISRHTLTCTLPDITLGASKLLRQGGRFFMVYPASELCRAFLALTEARLEPKRLRLVAQTPNDAPHLALIEAKKLAHPGLAMEPTLCLRDASGQETAELRRIYEPNV